MTRYGLFYCGVRGKAGRVLGSDGTPFPAMRRAAAIRFYQSALIFGFGPDARRVELRVVRGEGV